MPENINPGYQAGYEEPPLGALDDKANEPSAIKQKLGQVGRSLKKLDLRKQIVDYPFAAVGIAAAAGVIVGLVRPKPEPGRFSSLLLTTLGAIGFRLVREAAVKELGTYARNYIANRRDNDERAEQGSVRYTPAL
jgi:hypothetical protein